LLLRSSPKDEFSIPFDEGGKFSLLMNCLTFGKVDDDFRAGSVMANEKSIILCLKQKFKGNFWFFEVSSAFEVPEVAFMFGTF
jgi:hypothetical protein